MPKTAPKPPNSSASVLTTSSHKRRRWKRAKHWFCRIPRKRWAKMVSEVPNMIVLWNFATKSRLEASLAVLRNLLPYIFQGGLQPGSPSRRAAPGTSHYRESRWMFNKIWFKFPERVSLKTLCFVPPALAPRTPKWYVYPRLRTTVLDCPMTSLKMKREGTLMQQSVHKQILCLYPITWAAKAVKLDEFSFLCSTTCVASSTIIITSQCLSAHTQKSQLSSPILAYESLLSSCLCSSHASATVEVRSWK